MLDSGQLNMLDGETQLTRGLARARKKVAAFYSAMPPKLAAFYEAIGHIGAPIAYDDGRGRVLLVGDSLELIERLPAGSVDLFLTDPPYSSGGAFRGDRAQSTSSKYRLTGTAKVDPEFAGDTRDQRSYERWTVQWANAAYRATRSGGGLVCFTDWRQVAATVDAVQVAGWLYRGLSAWDKTEATRPQLGWFRQQLEFMVLASRGPISRGKPADGKASPGVFRCFLPGVKKHHLTEKPASMLAQVIETRPDWQTIVDPFGGSASTLVAAAELGRFALAIEVDKAVADVAAARLMARDAAASAARAA